jgi:2-polyprenyl-3-methyl-5-hydroxy-6-metoxy-1,4-benzoquinol methylase
MTDEAARMEANRRSWDEALPVHLGSRYYDVAAFRAGRETLWPAELEELGDVAGRTVLHLQCHFGLDSLSLASRGARVTGVDFSEPAVAQAAALAAELGLDARFLAANVYDLTRVLTEQFDIVFTSYGVLHWLPDIASWARIVARFVRPGGRFVISEFHPVGECFDEVDGRLQLARPLFQSDPVERLTRGTYADPSAELPPSTTYQWSWPVAAVVSALIDAGLRVGRLRELPVCPFQRFPCMVRGADGWWRVPADPIPLLFVCRAEKPAEGPSAQPLYDRGAVRQDE